MGRTNINLRFAGVDKCGRDVYVDQKGLYIVNTAMRSVAPSWHTKYPLDDFEGEPDLPMDGEHFDIFVDVWPDEIRFLYMLLNRLEMDVEYYLNYGNRNPNNLWAGSERGQIDKMREIYAKLPVKPEWLTAAKLDIIERELLPIENMN